MIVRRADFNCAVICLIFIISCFLGSGIPAIILGVEMSNYEKAESGNDIYRYQNEKIYTFPFTNSTILDIEIIYYSGNSLSPLLSLSNNRKCFSEKINSSLEQVLDNSRETYKVKYDCNGSSCICISKYSDDKIGFIVCCCICGISLLLTTCPIAAIWRADVIENSYDDDVC